MSGILTVKERLRLQSYKSMFTLVVFLPHAMFAIKYLDDFLFETHAIPNFILLWSGAVFFAAISMIIVNYSHARLKWSPRDEENTSPPRFLPLIMRGLIPGILISLMIGAGLSYAWVGLVYLYGWSKLLFILALFAMASALLGTATLSLR